MPDHLKAPGIGDSVIVGPLTYDTEGFLEDVKKRQRKEINKNIAVSDWHKRMFIEEKKKHPHKFPLSMRALKESPGPGEYVYENSEYYKKNKSF